MHEAEGATEQVALPGLLHWLRDSTLALPLVAVAVWMALQLAQRLLERRGPEVASARGPHAASGPRGVPSGRLAAPLVASLVAVYASVAVAAGNPIHGLLFPDAHGGSHEDLPFFAHLLRDGALALAADLALASGLVAVLLGRRWLARHLDWPRRVAVPGLTSLLVAASSSSLLAPSTAVPVAAAGTGVCATAVRTITYNVVAFQTLIPLNGWGDHQPTGLMYALSNADAMPNEAAIQTNPNLASPLVMRAAVGDCIQVTFRNDILGKRVGMHVDGVAKDPKTSDGARIGNNPDTTVPTGGSITYTWYAQREGEFPINDYGSGTNFKLPVNGVEQQDTTSLGLYGALIVVPRGATWHDIRTGHNLLNAANVAIGAPVQSDVHVDHSVPGAADYRDYVAVFGDEMEEVYDRDGKTPTFPTTGLQDSTFGINYRSEPLRNRMRAVMEHRGQVFDPVSGSVVATAPKTITLPNGRVIQPTDHFCDGFVPELNQVVQDPGARCLGEESHLTSWPFGDPSKLVHKAADGSIVVDTDNVIVKAYRHDPVRFHLVHPGIKETHPWHQHTNRWFGEPNDPKSERLDVQSTGPGESFLLKFEGGAGNIQGTVGDQVFHCHLYPHFAQGFWGTVRVFDRTRPLSSINANGQPIYADSTGKPVTYADGTPIEPLQELPDRVGNTPAADALHPGFPLFVKGDVGQKPYRPPFAVVNDPFQAQRRPGDTTRTGTPLERANMANNLTDAYGNPVRNALKADGTATPGTFFLDPCPTGVPERTYYPAAIDAKLVYNKAGWNDPNGKLYVEAPPATPDTGITRNALGAADKIRLGINAGTTQAEPYTIRARLGECVNLRLTAATNLDNDPNVPLDMHDPNGDAFHTPTPMSELSTHVHVVRFDEEGTDGTAVGWNYVQAPMIGQTYGYRWFVDQPLRTVFFHDHQFPNTHQQHGLFAGMNVEPADATWTDPKTGLPTNGVGTMADIHTKTICSNGVKCPDFREFTINYSDRIPQRDAAGAPLNPPGHPEDFGADQGVMAINYRNEPFPTRINSSTTGTKAEPGYIFSSAVFGDPSTPLLRAYQGDPVVIRFLNGAHEELHNFNLAGHRWLREPDDPNSNLYDTQAISLSEWFNFEVQGSQVTTLGDLTKARQRMRQESTHEYGATIAVPTGAGKPGDYLYSSQPMNDLWMGMWGIFRVPACGVSDLKPLPDRPTPATCSKTLSQWPALKPGQAIARPTTTPSMGTPCPVSTSTNMKTLKISLVQQKITYNANGDNDPLGVAYVLDSDLNPLTLQPKAGTNIKPLFIRANEGDCLVIQLTNRLPTTGIPIRPGDPQNPVEGMPLTNLVNGTPTLVRASWPAGNRASVHISGLVRYDVTWSDGSAVGYNFDSTVAPGSMWSYNWYIDTKDIGSANIQNLANLRGTRHHGAWGGLVAEPKGASYLDPATGQPITSGEAAVIQYADPATGLTRKYREFVIDFQDGLNLYDKNGVPVPDQVHGDFSATDPADPEDQGEKAINYRTERFQTRLANGSDIADVFSSVAHGDPATPVFRAYVGDPTMVRVLNSQDLPRGHTFGMFGHEWPVDLNDPNSNIVTAQGGLDTSRAFNLSLVGGAGGVQHAAGDYLYNDRNFFANLSGGLWGLLRVHDTPQPDLLPIQ